MGGGGGVWFVGKSELFFFGNGFFVFAPSGAGKVKVTHSLEGRGGEEAKKDRKGVSGYLRQHVPAMGGRVDD